MSEQATQVRGITIDKGANYSDAEISDCRIENCTLAVQDSKVHGCTFAGAYLETSGDCEIRDNMVYFEPLEHGNENE